MARSSSPRHQTLEGAELQRRAVALRRQRLSYRDIAEELGCSVSTAKSAYDRALAEVPASEVVAHRREELELVDDAVADLLTIAKGDGDDTSQRTRVEAWAIVLRWSEHRAKLLGLNAPTRSVQRVITEDSLEAGMRDLNARLAELPPTVIDAPAGD